MTLLEKPKMTLTVEQAFQNLEAAVAPGEDPGGGREALIGLLLAWNQTVKQPLRPGHLEALAGHGIVGPVSRISRKTSLPMGMDAGMAPPVSDDLEGKGKIRRGVNRVARARLPGIVFEC